MKKFYAIMAAAVVGSAAASAQLQSISFNKADLVPLEGFTWSEAPAVSPQFKTVASGVEGQAIRKAVSRAGEFDVLNGDFLITEVDPETPFNARLWTTNIALDGNTATITNFYYSDALPLTATVGYKDIEYSDGTTETLPLLTIPGWGDSENRKPYLMMAAEEGAEEEPWYLAFCDFSSKKMYTNDLEWYAGLDDGELPFNWPSNYGLAIANAAGQGFLFIQSPNLYKKNAEMTAMFYDGESGYEEIACPVWTYAFEGQYVDENQQPTGKTFTGVLAIGWGLCGECIRFIAEEVEENAYVAVAYDQVGWAMGDTSADEFYLCDCVIENGEPNYLWYDDKGEGLNWMVANVGVDGDGNTVFTQDGDWLLIGDKGFGALWKEGITVFDYYIGVGEGSNIEGVEAIESNDNAPAEYYNLQGVKVANPTPGQLYIVKQGSKVSKVIR